MLDSEECCGSGCNNCVLDQRLPTHHQPKTPISNILRGNYRKFKVQHIQQCAENVFKFVFKYAEASKNTSDRLSISMGSYLMLRAIKTWPTNINPIFQNFQQHTANSLQTSPPPQRNRHDDNTEDIYISRPYTPVDVCIANLEFTVLIKLEPHGAMSNYLQTLNIGDLTEWKGVYTKATFDATLFTHIICFCHGVALSTIYSISKSLVEDSNIETLIRVNVCFKDMDAILLRDELVELNGYWNFKSTIFLSQETTARPRLSESIIVGRINRERVMEIVEGCDLNEVLFLICGTKAFTSFIKTNLNELGYNKIETL